MKRLTNGDYDEKQGLQIIIKICKKIKFKISIATAYNAMLPVKKEHRVNESFKFFYKFS